MTVSVVIVNYNTFGITCACIESVIRHTTGVSYEIIVVDNKSPDDNPDEFLLLFPSIKLVKSDSNLGFAGGNNLGIARAMGDVILLLNSDTVLNEDSISIAATYLSDHPQIGALGVRLIYPDGRLQHTARRFRSIDRELLDLLRPILKLLPYKKRSQIMLNQYFRGDYDTVCHWVSGAFMMMPKIVLSKLPGGVLDERFFMYGEDQLWCYQLSLLGYQSFYLSATTVVHINNASTKPSKKLELLRKMLELELEIMKYRKGTGLYYYAFKAIFTAKEKIRYYIKSLVYRFSGRHMR